MNAHNLRTRARALAGGAARSALHAAPLWLQPKLRTARRRVKAARARYGARRGPLLSIIVPMYRVEMYLPACLDSLIEQTYRNLQIVVVDDGSPDGSRAIAESYAKRDPRIRIITRPNGGLSAARNTGIDNATGEYLTFVDSDDVVLPVAYQAAMSALRRTGSDFAVFSYQRMNSTRRWAPPRWIQDAHAQTRLHTNIDEFPEAQANAISCSKVFRRSFWDAHQLRFPEGVVYEDQPVTTHAYAYATAFDFLPGRYYLWRQREDRTSISQQVHTVADLQARIDAAMTSLAILADSGHQRAYDTRLGQFLANDFPQSLVLVNDTDEDFWNCLRDGMRALTANATPQIWAQVSPQHRLLYDLITSDRRAEAEHLLDVGGGNLKNFPTVVADRRVRTLLPYHDDPTIVPDPHRLDLRPHQLRVQTAIRRLEWTDQATITIRGWAYIDNIDLSDTPTQITLVLVNPDTGQTVTVPTEPAPDPAVSRISKHKYCNYEHACFVASIAPSDWPEFRGTDSVTETWQVDVTVTTAGVDGREPLCGFNVWGSAGVPGSRMQPDGLRLACSASKSDQLTIRRYYPRVALTDASVDERTITMRLQARESTTLRSVTINDRARRLRLTEMARRDDTGDYTVRFRLPTAGPGRWGWYVRAETTAQEELAIGWNPSSDDILTTAQAERFAGVWLARTPAGNTTVCQQQQRVRIRDARITDSDDALIVEADLDGSGELTATLLNGRIEPVGAITEGERSLSLYFPLTASAFGGPTLPLPPGRYEFDLRRATGPGSVRVTPDLADDLLRRLPIEIEHQRLRARIERTSNAGHLSLAILSPLAPDERGARQQRELQDAYSSDPAIIADPTVRTVPSAGLTLRPNAVLFRTSYGENAACNAAAIHRELRRRAAPVELFWAVTDYSVAVPDGGIPVVVGSRQWYELLRTVGYLIENMHQPIYHFKPEHQIIVETFHGYPFKRMGHPHWHNLGFPRGRIESFDRRANEWDYLVSPATYATPLLRRDFRYDGEVLEIGYPRNDVLRSEQAGSRRELIRKQLGIEPDQIAVLYAPTFRDYLSRDDHHARMVDFLDLQKVTEAFGDDGILLLRGHAFNARAGSLVSAASTNIVDLTRYPDVADLYLAADAAIVDYSSLRFDFAITGKPMIFHVPDLARYRDESRGWLFDFEPTAPGPMVDTTDEVLHELSRLDEVRATYQDAYARFRHDYLDLDDGHAAERFVDAVFVPRGHAPLLVNGFGRDDTRTWSAGLAHASPRDTRRWRQSTPQRAAR